MQSFSVPDRIDAAANWVRQAQRVTVLTGAGVSTDSGIPDFRGPNGLWTKNPDLERASNIRHFLSDPELRQRSWRSRLENGVFAAQPNACHHALYRLERHGRLEAIITQNVDGLHHAAGHHPDRVLEVHGTVHYARCYDCRERWPMSEMLGRVRAGDLDPRCDRCGGIVKSDVVLFGEQLVPEVIGAAFDAAERCDVFIAAGSTLAVHPAAGLVPAARSAGAKVIIVNGQPTEMDHLADIVVQGDLATSLAALIPVMNPD